MGSNPQANTKASDKAFRIPTDSLQWAPSFATQTYRMDLPQRLIASVKERRDWTEQNALLEEQSEVSLHEYNNACWNPAVHIQMIPEWQSIRVR